MELKRSLKVFLLMSISTMTQIFVRAQLSGYNGIRYDRVGSAHFDYTNDSVIGIFPGMESDCVNSCVNIKTGNPTYWDTMKTKSLFMCSFNKGGGPNDGNCYMTGF